ncbi:hypothetical protein NQ315_009302 [Exocentrus adspersus]|uniref:Uncharacterized protein n=1 Tax=Exocentrus adspersus TaxID=1586481 RepID=A0AAV8WGB1_9CUCU|nr:hypothetical protein NQ315_009302 [Exocentrus adspersus]
MDPSENTNLSPLESTFQNFSETPISAHLYDAESGETSEKTPEKEKFVRVVSIALSSFLSGNLSITSDFIDLNLCDQYCDIITFSKRFVDGILEEAEGLINKHSKKSSLPIGNIPIQLNRNRESAEFYPVIVEYERPKFSVWPSIAEFTIELGAEKIDEYLSSFSTNEDWLYIIYYLGNEIDATSHYYKYEAVWSLPSPEYPIAQATASVFFTIEVSDVLPPRCIVSVTFQFESFQFTHTPGVTDFSEEWLNYILDSKIGVYKKIKY